MAILFLDKDILEDSSKWSENSEVFKKAIDTYIESHYKGDDSENVYALFNDAQIKLLRTYFKGFSVEMYKELNGTVELQIQKKNAKVKEKINRIGEAMGGPINLEDWVYDGLVDYGKNNSQKCDLCPRPIRYAHYAVNKKTKECLRFGCNCASDFFSMDKGTLANMRSIQAQTLKDIKYIACVVELNQFKEYYNFMCGYTGRVVLEEGEQGLRDLRSFKIKWNKDGTLDNGVNGECLVKFSDNTTVTKSLQWVKEHISACLNADLDDDIYQPLEKRIMKRKVLKKEDESQLNTGIYVTFALKFMELGLPIPMSICKKINSIVAKISRQSHPDYIKYAQELLISHNLEKSALLKRAFTDFIVNYLASSMKIEERDPELEYWGIRGQKTFYNTVRNWEVAMLKLLALKEFYSLVSQNLVTEKEFDKFLRARGFKEKGMYSERIKAYMKRCMKLFMNNKEVIKSDNPNIVREKGISKYTLKDVDDEIPLYIKDGIKVGKKFNTGYFTPETIPIDIGLHYYAMQQSYKDIVTDSLAPTLYFLKYFLMTDSVEESIRYLCALINDSFYGIIHLSYQLRNTYYKTPDYFKTALKQAQVDEDFCNEMLNKYRGIIPQFKEDCKILYEQLVELQKDIMQPIIKTSDLTPSYINSEEDYENLVLEKKKTNKDYFKDYCNLLVAKRGTKRIQDNICQRNLYVLTIYKQFEKYNDMLIEIQKNFTDSLRKQEENKLYDKLHLFEFKEELSKYLNVEDIDTFIKFIICRRFCDLYGYNMNYSDRNIVNRLKTDLIGFNVPLKEKMVLDNIDKIIPSGLLESCLENRQVFDELYQIYKDLFVKIKGFKGVVKFKAFLDLLEETDLPYTKEYLNGKDLVTTDTYINKLNNDLRANDNFIDSNIIFKNSGYKTWDAFSYTSIFKNVLNKYKEIDEIIRINYNKIQEEKQIKEEEERLKGPYVSKLKTLLLEHLHFFEVDINSVRKSYPSEMSEVSIRQRESFKVVRYQNSYNECKRFKEVLEELGENNWSVGVKEVIVDFDNVLAHQTKKIRACCEALKAEMYNKKLIFNHFNITYKVLSALNTIDLTVLNEKELISIISILEYYYLFKNQIEYIDSVVSKYNSNKGYSFVDEMGKLPNPTIVNIKDMYDNLLDKPDSTGLTGVEKAERVKNHSNFNTLDSFLQSVVNTVCNKQNCSSKQLKFVNTAFETLGLGKTDEVKTVVDSGSDEGLKLAQEIQNHPNFSTLPKLNQDIINSVVKFKKCSPKQKFYVLKAKELLNI